MKAVAVFFIGLWTSALVVVFLAASIGYGEDPKNETASGICLLLGIAALVLGFAYMGDVVRSRDGR